MNSKPMTKAEVNKAIDTWEIKTYCCSGYVKNKPLFHRALAYWLGKKTVFAGDPWRYCPWCGKRRPPVSER